VLSAIDRHLGMILAPSRDARDQKLRPYRVSVRGLDASPLRPRPRWSLVSASSTPIIGPSLKLQILDFSFRIRTFCCDMLCLDGFEKVIQIAG
jgi:hypothetical protein